MTRSADRPGASVVRAAAGRGGAGAPLAGVTAVISVSASFDSPLMSPCLRARSAASLISIEAAAAAACSDVLSARACSADRRWL